MMTKVSSLSQKNIKVKGEDRQEVLTIEIMVGEIIKIDIGQIVEIGEYHSVPLNTKISGLSRYIKDREAVCLMEDQVKYIYKKVETENVVKVDPIKQEIEEDKLDKMDDTNGEINPYHEKTTNKVEKDNIIISQMEQWSILSNVVNYIQYDSYPKIIMI